MRKFKNIARVVFEAREHRRYSQQDLAQELGYKNGQFISNVERGKCGIPAEKLFLLSKILGTSPVMYAEALLSDYREYLTICIKEETPPALPIMPKIVEKIDLSKISLGSH